MEENKNPESKYINNKDNMTPSDNGRHDNTGIEETKRTTSEIDTSKSVINFGAIFQMLGSHYRLFLKVWVLTFILSSAYIVCIPRYYSTSTRVAPETEAGADALGSLASSFGFDLGESGSADAIYPLLYPDLMDDNGFVSTLFDIKVTTADGTISTTYYDYLENHQKSAPWGKTVEALKKMILPSDDPTPLKSMSGEKGFNPYILNKKQDTVVRHIRKSIGLVYDKKTSVITINVEDQDRQICKQVADSVRIKLQQHITEYRTLKAKNDVAYYQKLTDEAYNAYVAVRRQYASFSDANTDISLPSLQSKLDDMENDMQLKYSTYTAMNTQLQAAMSKLREKTPAFTMLQGAAMPLKPAGPKRMFFVIGMELLVTFAMIFYYLRKMIANFI